MTKTMLQNMEVLSAVYSTNRSLAGVRRDAGDTSAASPPASRDSLMSDTGAGVGSEGNQ
jgi:hypothetical protein